MPNNVILVVLETGYCSLDEACLVCVARTDWLKERPIELKGFHGQVMDIVFAFLDERILVADV